MHIPVTGFAAAFCGLLILALGLRVSWLRVQHRVALGDGGVAVLLRAIRSHANTVEQVPVFLLQCACYEIYVGASLTLIGVVAAFLLARLIHAWGLARGTLTLARRVGAGLTFLTQGALSLMLLTQVLTTLF